jgi:hypothetical protein
MYSPLKQVIKKYIFFGTIKQASFCPFLLKGRELTFSRALLGLRGLAAYIAHTSLVLVSAVVKLSPKSFNNAGYRYY